MEWSITLHDMRFNSTTASSDQILCTGTVSVNLHAIEEEYQNNKI